MLKSNAERKRFQVNEYHFIEELSYYLGEAFSRSTRDGVVVRAIQMALEPPAPIKNTEFVCSDEEIRDFLRKASDVFLRLHHETKSLAENTEEIPPWRS